MQWIIKNATLAIVLLVLIFPLNVFAYNCLSIDGEIEFWQKRLSDACRFDPQSIACINAKQKVNTLSQWRAMNCVPGGCEANGYDYKDTGYRSGSNIIGRFFNGEETFCLQADQKFNSCGVYSAHNQMYGATERIVEAIYGYNQTNKTDKHYAAAQAMIWGSEIPNGCEQAYQDILAKLPKKVSKHTSIQMEKDRFYLDLNE